MFLSYINMLRSLSARRFLMAPAILLFVSGGPLVSSAQAHMQSDTSFLPTGPAGEMAHKRANTIYLNAVNDMALKEAEEGCAKQNALSCAQLSRRYEMGDAVAKDEAKAKQAADKAWALAKDQCPNVGASSCLVLGELYMRLAQDRAEAQKIFASICTAGDAKGCTAMGQSYYRLSGDISDDENISKIEKLQADREASVIWFTKACKMKSAAGCYQLGKRAYTMPHHVRAMGENPSPAAYKAAAKKAKAYYQQALAIDPDFAPAHDALLDLDNEEYFASVRKALAS